MVFLNRVCTFKFVYRLTLFISVNYSPGYQNSSSNEWNTWTDKSFGVESKIEEYRRRQQEQLQRKKSKELPQEPDYFNDLRPDIKAPKRLDIQHQGHSSAPRKNLFEFNENDIQIPQVSNFYFL